MEGVTPAGTGNFCVSQWSHGAPLVMSLILSKGFCRLKRFSAGREASLAFLLLCAVAVVGTRRMAVVAIASRWLSSLFMIQNSAALLFDLLYKHLSNKKDAQDFVLSDFPLTLVLQFKTSKNHQ